MAIMSVTVFSVAFLVVGLMHHGFLVGDGRSGTGCRA
jgi:hypothetical protein